MKRNSKIISLLFAVIMILSSMPFAGISALAATSGDFEYEILDDGTAEITDYTGEVETLEIPSTLDGYTVTSIGYSAFFDCESLTSVTIPDSVTSISDGAFSHCDSLTGVTIPNSVTSIGDFAFAWCDSLKSITIPDGVTSIGEGAFAGCYSLTSITIPNSVTSIGDGVFDFSAIDRIYGYENSYAQSYAEENGYKFVVFNDFVNEESRDFNYEILDDGTAEITGYTGSAETLEIPATLDGYTVTSIGNYAFDECYLTSITIPDSVKSIGDSAFFDCYSLTNVVIGKGVTSIGEGAFYNCESLKSITADENNKNYSSQDGVLFNKDKTELLQYPAGNERKSYSIPNGVAIIGDEAFHSCDSLTDVTIPNSVTSIGDYAFHNCDSLTSITIPDSVTSIGVYAFCDCDSLTSVTIPNSVTSIGGCAFNGCGSLTSITIPDSVTSIGSSAFYGTGYYNDDANWENGVLYIGNHLIEANNDEIPSEYSINEGTITIADDAFAWCDSLTSITIPDSVTSIGYDAFDWCENLTSITVDENNKNYSSHDGVLFNKDKTELIQYPIGNERTSYSIPDSVTSIGDSAFNGCDSLTSVDLGVGVTSIGDNAFNCISLTSITVDENNKNYSSQDGVLFNKEKTELIQYPIGNERTSYNIPASVTNIGNDAFWGCTSLTSVTIPDSVTSIGSFFLFEGSPIKTIYGYENSYAQTYAEENGLEFVPLYTYESFESGITVDADKSGLPEDTELVVTVKEETEDSVTYDISLQSGDAEVQPTGSVTVKIPVPDTMNGESVKVYRREADGTMTDMSAVYKDGFMVFTTEHFSEYLLKAEESEVKGEPGDVNGDGKINALDVLIVKRYIAKYDDAKLEGDMFTRADVSGDGKVNAKDALAIMQKIAKLITSFDEIK